MPSEPTRYVSPVSNQNIPAMATYGTEVIELFLRIGLDQQVPCGFWIEIWNIVPWQLIRFSAVGGFVTLLLAGFAEGWRLIRTVASRMSFFLAKTASSGERTVDLWIRTVDCIMAANTVRLSFVSIRQTKTHPISPQL
jgi:hypothetical protein